MTRLEVFQRQRGARDTGSRRLLVHVLCGKPAQVVAAWAALAASEKRPN
jgi:hypothetical protein